MFDEGVKKFERFGNFSFERSDPFGMHCSSDNQSLGSTWHPSSNQVKFTEPKDHEENDEEDDAEALLSAKFDGLRKARFFHGCLRADRAFETARLPAAGPPHSARQTRRSEPPSDNNAQLSSSPQENHIDAGEGRADDFSMEAAASGGRFITKLVNTQLDDKQYDYKRLDVKQYDEVLSATKLVSFRSRQIWESNRSTTSIQERAAPSSARVSSGEPTNEEAPARLSPSSQPRRLGSPRRAGSKSGVRQASDDQPLNIQDSMSGFVTSCKQAQVLPRTTGIIRADGEKLRLECGGISDERAEAIMHTLRASSSLVKEAFLSSNGLTEQGAKHLLRALPDEVETIDLSQNYLGRNDAWCSGLSRLVHLRSLNVSDSQLGDNVCGALCVFLGVCRQLRTLNLSANHICKAAGAVASLIQGLTALQELDVHWNRIAGDSACDLVRGLLENGHAGGNLGNVNLSFNPIGRGGGEQACKLLAQVFCENTTLHHLDLCKCDLQSYPSRQCEILAEGLKENTTILGIHLGGNQATVNARGFIVPAMCRTCGAGPRCAELAKLVNGLPAICRSTPTSRGAGAEVAVDPSKALHSVEDQIKSSKDVGCPKHGSQYDCLCWVCSRWTETRIVFTPGISGPAVSDVWVFTSVDNFEQATKLSKGCGDSLVAYFMCPPGTLHFIFQVGNDVMASRTAPTIYDVKPSALLRRMPAVSESDGKNVTAYLPIHLKGQRILVKEFLAPPAPPAQRRHAWRVTNEHLQSATECIEYRGSKKLDDMTGGTGAAWGSLVEGVDEGDGWVRLDLHEDEHGNFTSLLVEVSFFNTKVVLQRELDVPVCECYVPRKVEVGEVNYDQPETTWTVENSLFGPYSEALQRRAFCDSCFEVDWTNSSIASLVEDPVDRASVRDILRAHYAEIHVLYGSLVSVEQQLLSSNGEASLTFGVTLNEFTHMLVQHHILGSATDRSVDELTLQDADAQFLLAAAPGHASHTWASSTHKSGRILLRHGFFELLVRLAILRFRREDIMPSDSHRGDRSKPKAKSASHALDILMNKHIMYPHPPMKFNFNCVQWRGDVLHSEEVEAVLRKHMKTVIDPLFQAFSCTSNEKLGRYLQVQDWFALLDGLQVLPCNGEHSVQNAWDRSWVWQISAIAEADELTRKDHLQMVWPEFLEAIARLVGLLAARKRKYSEEEAEKIDYGLKFHAPSYAFCSDGNHITDRTKFAQILDEFLGQESLKRETRNGQRRKSLSGQQ